jgi:cytochrome b6-f complex iron-sulfur subunit
MRRRDFVWRLPVLGPALSLGASALALGGCAGPRYVVPRSEAGRLVVALSELAATGDVLLQAPGMQRPVYLRRLGSGEFVALLLRCTHAGCQPEPAGDRLTCPCHGSEFSFDGNVLQGPAERALTRYPVELRGDDVAVRLEGGER